MNKMTKRLTYTKAFRSILSSEVSSTFFPQNHIIQSINYIDAYYK